MAVDINSLWNQSKATIKAANTLLSDPSISDDDKLKSFEQFKSILETNFVELSKFWRRHLIIARDQFYGLMLVNMDIVLDFNIDGVVDTDISKTPIVIKLNPLYMENYIIENVEAILCSEIIQLAMDYPTRFSNLNVQRDQAKHEALVHAASISAMELVKNQIHIKSVNTSKDSSHLRIPADAYTLSDIRSDTNRNIEQDKALEYYFAIWNNADEKNKSNNGKGLSRPNSQGLDGKNDFRDRNQKLPSTPNNRNGVKCHQWENDKDKEETRTKIKGLVQSTLNNMNSESRGLMPGQLKEEIELLLAPPQIPWQKRIPKFIGQLPYKHRKTRLRPNRKMPERLDKMGQLPDHIVKIVIGMDTSGSVDNITAQYFLNEIFGILKKYPTQITLIQCDAEIQGEPIIMRSPSDWPGETYGHGGTAFTPVFEYVNAHDFRDAFFIYLTDGYGEARVPKPRVAKMMWVVKNNDKYLSVEEPYGLVEFLKDDPNYTQYLEKNRGR